MKQSGQLSLVEGLDIRVSTLGISSKLVAPGNAELGMHERFVAVVEFNVDEVHFSWKEEIGRIRHHKVSVERIIMVPPQHGDRVIDDAVEMQKENIEAARGLEAMVDGG